jgi:prepilin signal peptidase PulO-like enzyme (type II secretory pathway)
MEQSTLEILLFALLGTIFGSFNSLLIHRLPIDEAVVFTRSACPKCKNKLCARDLIPIISWLINFAKCRFCKSPISIRYPLLEGGTAALFIIIYHLKGFNYSSLILCLLTSNLLVLCIIDFKWRIIPDSLQIVVGTLGLIYGFISGLHIADMLAGAILGGLIGLSLQIIIKWWKKQDGLGMGDVKFMVASGIWLGTNLIPYYFYSGLFGVITAIVWQLWSKDPRFPFGPALALSLLLLLLHSDAENWYLEFSVNFVTMLGLI